MIDSICVKCGNVSCHGKVYKNHIAGCEDFRPVTNYDIIVSKTPYELAAWFAKTFGDEGDYNLWMKFLCASADKEGEG